MVPNSVVWVLVIALIIVILQYVYYFRNSLRSKKELDACTAENVKLVNELARLKANHNAVIDKMGDISDFNDIEFTFKNGDDIGDRSVKIKRTPDGVKYYTRAKRNGKFTDVEVFPVLST